VEPGDCRVERRLLACGPSPDQGALGADCLLGRLRRLSRHDDRQHRLPRHLGLWLPGSLLTGIGLAFPTLGSAAVRDVPIDRFATASAVNAAFRQVGAVLGTAILVAIVGEPASLAAAPSVSDGAFLFAAVAALVAGAVTLTLWPVPAPAGVDAAGGPDASAAVAYETAST
jgi:hypothetical protein